MIAVARPSEIDDTSFEKAAQTAADEEDLFLSRGGDEMASSDEDEFGGDDDFTEEPGSTPGATPTEGEKE